MRIKGEVKGKDKKGWNILDFFDSSNPLRMFQLYSYVFCVFNIVSQMYAVRT